MNKKFFLIATVCIACSNKAMEKEPDDNKNSPIAQDTIGSPRGSFEEIIYRGFSNTERALLQSNNCSIFIKEKITKVYQEDKEENDKLINRHVRLAASSVTQNEALQEKQKAQLLKLELELYKIRELALVRALAELGAQGKIKVKRGKKGN